MNMYAHKLNLMNDTVIKLWWKSLKHVEESRQSRQLNCGGGHNAQETCTQGMDAYSDDCS